MDIKLVCLEEGSCTSEVAFPHGLQELLQVLAKRSIKSLSNIFKMDRLGDNPYGSYIQKH